MIQLEGLRGKLNVCCQLKREADPREIEPIAVGTSVMEVAHWMHILAVRDVWMAGHR